MKFRHQLILSLAIIGLIVFSGLIIIYLSVAGVKDNAVNQTQQVVAQTDSINMLEQSVADVPPALAVMNDIAALKNDINTVQYSYANASLTLDKADLDIANEQMNRIQPRILSLVRTLPDGAQEIAALEEALGASRIFGNKMNDFLLDDLPNVAGDMARGLGAQMLLVKDVLDRLSRQSVSRVNDSVSQVTRQTDVVKNSARLVSDSADAIVTESTSMSRIVMGVGFVVIALMCAIAIYTTRALKKATRQVGGVLDQISKTQNLTLRVNRREEDELGMIARNVDGMMANFEKVVIEVDKTADEVSSEIDAMSTRSGSLNHSVTDLLQSVDSISTAVVELSASASEVSNNASATAENTREAHKIGSKGTQIVNDSIDNVKSLSDKLLDSQNTIHQLEQDVGEIGGVLAVIEGIAEQTNLLALNAAIEAARAGEQGRGFAVVADEVRSLASRTQESTVEIRQTIDSLRGRTKDVVETMQGSINASEESVALAKQASTAITHISESLTSILDLNQLIATAAKEQSDVATDISSRVNLLSESAQDMSVVATENQAAGDRMSTQGKQLRSAVAIFNLG